MPLISISRIELKGFTRASSSRTPGTPRGISRIELKDLGVACFLCHGILCAYLG